MWTARERPKDADPTWMGHSVGHWEGDVLVVEAANFNDKSLFAFESPAHRAVEA